MLNGSERIGSVIGQGLLVNGCGCMMIVQELGCTLGDRDDL